MVGATGYAIRLTPGESAAAVQSPGCGDPRLASSFALNTIDQDVQVTLVDGTYYVTYQGLLAARPAASSSYAVPAQSVGAKLNRRPARPECRERYLHHRRR